MKIRPRRFKKHIGRTGFDDPHEADYGTQTADGETTLIGPAPSLDDKAAVAEAKDVAMARFGRELADTLRLLREKQRVPD